jgi:hypothetical protein
MLATALHVVRVRTKGFKEGIDELDSCLGFFVAGALVEIQVSFDALDQIYGFRGCCYVVFPGWCLCDGA